MILRRLLLAAALLAAPLAHAQTAPQPLPPEQAALKGHVQFLASDAMRGREAGTRDYEIAAEYVAAQMLAIGLQPGVEGSWFQPLKLVAFKPAEKAKWSLVRGSSEIPLQFGIDFVNTPAPATPDFKAEGGMVFAGYGIVYPEGKRDDYKGLDVKGKIVAILPGVPKGLPNEVEAHFGDDEQKAAIAQAKGAVAVVVLESVAQREQFPFEAIVPYYDYERNTWARPDGTAFAIAAGAPPVGYVGGTGAEKLFQGAKIKWSEVLAAERKGTKIPTGPLVGTLKVASKTRLVTQSTRNVVGMIPGSDPALKGEYVVLSAHLDHVGVGDAVNGDRIYNGAMDNAVGVSTMLEVARKFIASGEKPKRSMLFVALAGEEKGLLGSDYFAHYPPVPKDKLVADVNMDMPILTYPLVDVVALGGERSSLGPVIAAAAASEGLKVVPDPSPEEMFFVRSDHYSFVKSGVPAVSLDTGPGGQGAEAQKKFLAENYHKPSDQIDLPFDWNSAAKYMRLNYAIARTLTDAPERPRWNKGDFFGVQFGGYGAE
ncbi:M28 family metallopeptidase [Sphingomonas sp. NIBR02145]|uniref:M28 family metallopeptidase n=1 Tax=Sphingomonas sp. NIBR02145 TaxID=3014784 RepID=UPI0022B39B19|nr:M28 family metallopeptidase [Sphingomonas sp. NIBR02145]WHU01291.1 M28 family metallopeptidase [Sphingomonas sp. NIBR02145]